MQAAGKLYCDRAIWTCEVDHEVWLVDVTPVEPFCNRHERNSGSLISERRMTTISGHASAFSAIYTYICIDVSQIVSATKLVRVLLSFIRQHLISGGINTYELFVVCVCSAPMTIAVKYDMFSWASQLMRALHAHGLVT